MLGSGKQSTQATQWSLIGMSAKALLGNDRPHQRQLTARTPQPAGYRPLRGRSVRGRAAIARVAADRGWVGVEGLIRLRYHPAVSRLYLMTDSDDHVLLDLTAFGDRAAAIDRARYGSPGSYTAIARNHMAKAENLTPRFMLFGSFVARTRGLHEAVVREIEVNNPHAVFPLIRSWVEVVTIAMYVIQKPAYAQYLQEGPGTNMPAKKSFEAMFHAVKDEAGQLRQVYGQLSEFSHFGP